MRTYRAKIVAVSPKHRQATLLPESAGRSEGCMLGYSLGNDQFGQEKMRGMVEWIERRYRRCAVLVGDSIYRLSLQIDRSVPEADALREALRLGRERAEQVRAITARSASCCFEVLPCSEMTAHPYYDECHDAIEALLARDERFAGSVRAFSAMFLRRRDSVTDEHLALSRRYLSEELAIMACAHREGFETFVYPGNLAIAAELSAGVHPGAPRELREMTTVSLDLRPRASAPVELTAE